MPSAVRVRTSSGWQDIALQGPPGPAGAGVPTPVVNGQWIKGVGGTAVWAAIDGSDIADNSITNAKIAAAAAIEANKLNWHFGTTPPSSPADGMIWVYTGANFFWMFIYQAAEATYKWKFVGGGPLRVGIATDETITADSTYRDPPTPGPTATLPRGGDYYFMANCGAYYASQTAQGQHNIKCTISSGSLETNDSTIGSAYCAGGIGVSCVSQGVNTSAAASGTIKMQYASTGGVGTAHVRWRMLSVWPIRVI